MSAVAGLLAAYVGAFGALPGATTPSPTPSLSPSLPAQAPDPNSVTPGLLGFLVVFLLALATWLLMRNLTARLRRMRFREEQRQAAEGSGPPPPDGAPPAG